MIIKGIKINAEGLDKEFSLSEHNNLIHSNDNSRGKTTLLRLILYSLGYNIPGTKLFPIDNRCTVEATVVTDSNKEIRITRPSTDYLSISVDGGIQTICIPDQLPILHHILFNTANTNVLNNILGTFYLDQEKGWTLLNRGVVIGSIHFNVEELIQGLSNRDCSALKEKEESIIRELNRYQQISSVAKYKETLDKASGTLLPEPFHEGVDLQIEQLQFELSAARKELGRIDAVLKDNQQIKSYVSKMKLLVQAPSGEVIPVTADNLIGLNDSIDYLIAKRKIKASECRGLSNNISKLQKQKGAESSELFTVESVADAFDAMVQQFQYGYVTVETTISSLKQQLRDIRKQITDETRFNNDVVSSLFESILHYAEALEIGNSNTIAQNYLFTSNLKVLSGAVLHKTVFAFRLAYILEIKKRLGVKLPIILDSPRGKEIDLSNIRLMVDILKKDFSDHQIILASIYKYDLPNVNEIELQNMLME